MADIVAEFFQIIGTGITPPSDLAQLIPYLLRVVVGIALVSGVFGVIGKIAEIFTNFRRW